MRVYDIYAEASEYLGTNDQTHIFRALTRAVEYVANKGDWDVLKGYVDLPVTHDYFVVLPWQVDVPLKFTIDDIPAFSRDRLYEFTLNGFGSSGGGADRVDYTWEDRGFIPTGLYVNIPSGFWVILAGSAADAGKRVFIRGQRPNNVEVNETLTIDPVNYVFSTGLFKNLTEINKEVTTSFVSLFAWAPPPAPPNDNFVNAQLISGSDSDPANPIVGTTLGATIEPGEPAGVNTVWYKWVGTGDRTRTSFFTRRDFFIDIYTGIDVAHLVHIGTSSDNGSTSQITFSRINDQLYMIRVRPPDVASPGSFTLGWQQVHHDEIPVPPIPLSGGASPRDPVPTPPTPEPPEVDAPVPLPPQAILPAGSILIAQYFGRETNPRYRLVRLSVKGTTARFLFRRKVFKILSMDDFIPVQSELGLLTMVQSIQALRRKDLEVAKAMADAAVEITTDAQRATTGFIELANNTEVQDARSYNLYNRDTVLVLDVFDEVAKILGNVGQFNIFDHITTALEVLCSKGHWDGLTGYVDITTDGRRNVTLPRFVDQPVTISVNGRPAYMRNKWSEFHLNGPGSDEYGGQYMGGTWQNFSGYAGAGRWGQISAWDSVGEVVTIKPIGMVSQLVAVPDDQSDDGKTYRIYGYDETGKWIMEDGEDGFTIVVNHEKLFPNINTDQKVARITRITRQATKGFVRLWAYDATTQTTSVLLGYHYPDETEPKYFRIKLPIDAQWIRLRYRKRTLKVTSVWQPLHLHSRMAIITMARSLMTLEKDAAQAQVLEDKAVRFLDDDQKSRNPGESFQLQFNEDCGWNSNFTVS